MDEELAGPILTTVAELQQSLKEVQAGQQEAHDGAVDARIQLQQEE